MREKLAELCHEQWSGWMEYLFSKSIPYRPGDIQADKGALIIPQWAVERWSRQMKTPYSELSDNEQSSDRNEADRFLRIFKE